jgi:hypothetical protein
VITLTDYFSKWAEAAPIPTKEACHVTSFLYQMMLQYGCPEEIVSDQGREFCNRVVDQLEQLTGFKHIITSAYHPQSNGLDERLNQTLKGQLQKMVNDNQDNWDDLLENVLFAYRTSRQDSTKCTPFLLMFGREARLPIDLTRAKYTSEQQEELSFDDKVKKMLEMQKTLHDKARENIHNAQERQKKQYDAKHNSRTNLKVGDKVLVQEMKNEGRKGGKLDVQFKGPYVIAEDLGKGRFRLANEDGVTLKKSVNCHRIKPWHNPDEGRLQPPRKRKRNDWVPELGLTTKERQELESGVMLTDVHMHAAHSLLKKQFPTIQGCQSTLLQQNGGFREVSGEGMP